MKEDSENLFWFYDDAIKFIKEAGYESEMQTQDKLVYSDLTSKQFFHEFVWVVFSAGISNSATISMMKKFVDSDYNPETVKHELKRNAVTRGINEYVSWFDELQTIKTDRERIEYFQQLPFIGKITKYHLAKNIGIDCVKPDRHLILLAKKFHYDNPRLMCEFLAKKFEHKLRVVDVVLWRFCNLRPDIVKKMKQELK